MNINTSHAAKELKIKISKATVATAKAERKSLLNTPDCTCVI